MQATLLILLIRVGMEFLDTYIRDTKGGFTEEYLDIKRDFRKALVKEAKELAGKSPPDDPPDAEPLPPAA